MTAYGPTSWDTQSFGSTFPSSSDAAVLKKIGGFAGTGAEISAYDAVTKRLFVVSGDATLQVLDLSNPSEPRLVQTLNVSAFGSSANSVAVSNGLVAIAVQAQPETNPGKVVFYDTLGNFQQAVTVGALPDMLTFTPDGKKVLVANEGQPSSYNQPNSVDPVGSISIIDLSNGLAQANVATAGFDSFNPLKADLQARGVRITGPNATVAQDLEPEYITISPDGKTAWVSLQENNSIAVIDIATAKVTSIQPLGLKDLSRGQPTVTNYAFTDLPVLGTTATVNPSNPAQTAPGQDIRLGGFSGLFFEGRAENGNLKFITNTDRGPNGEPADLIPRVPGSERPFLLPDFQPRLVRFELNQITGKITVTEQITLKREDGTPLTGLPNLQSGATGTAYTDEVPADLFKNQLPNDPVGADLEGVVVAVDGTFWLGDEYRPAIYHFDANGTLIDRFIPEGTPTGSSEFGTPALPAVYAQRRSNRGFEAVALEGTKLYAFIQSAIDNPDTPGDTISRGSRNLRILEFDTVSQTVTGEFLYTLDDVTAAGNARTDKIGDAAALGNGKFLVVERDDLAGTDSNKLVYEIDLKGATRIDTFQPSAPSNRTIEQLTIAELNALGIKPVDKRLVTNAATIGYTGVEKLEGLALIDANTFALINDNDFGVGGATPKGDGTLSKPTVSAEVQLGIVQFDQSNAIDASDRDGGVSLRNQPVFGLYQPDAIAQFTVNGNTYIISANEGDTREYAGFTDEVRVGSSAYRLDPTIFPNAADLKNDAVLGRLRVSPVDGDLNGDGLIDRITTFGGRSFSIRDTKGNLVFDSGDQLERITAAAVPTLFNSNGTADTFDTRSDDKGPEPEGVVIGVVGDRTYAFLGLERVGGIMTYDVTDPNQPIFIEYINTSPSEVGPEGLTFIDAAKSPNGKPLLITSNEVSKTVAIFEFNPPRTIAGKDTIGTAQGYAGGGGDNLIGDGKTIISLKGDDFIYAGSDSERFGLSAGLGFATIVGFGSNDRISLGSGLRFADLTVSQVNSDTLLSVAATNDPLATLQGVQASSITPSTFGV
jgi:hypothetical protein